MVMHADCMRRGSTVKIKAAVLRKSSLPRPYADSLPLGIEGVELDPPSKGEVLLQIKAVGLCHPLHERDL